MEAVIEFIFTVIFFRIGKWILGVITFRRIDVSINSTLQPLASLIGGLVVIGAVLAVIVVVTNFK